jgi:hypothetical protein
MTAPEIASFHLPIDAQDREVVAELQRCSSSSSTSR